VYIIANRYPSDECIYKDKKIDKYYYNNDEKKCFPLISCLFLPNSCAGFSEKGDFITCGKYSSVTKTCS
jgi:hypothetical protein